jgi:antitoxin component YwqK of YwqJK toxin-antitoxin module
MISCGPSSPMLEVNYDEIDWKEDVYYHNGKPFTGRTIQLHADGTIRTEWEIKNGLMHGIAREYDEAGNQLVETEFHKGKRHGNNYYWDAAGTMIKHQIYEHGTSVSEETFGSLAK